MMRRPTMPEAAGLLSVLFFLFLISYFYMHNSPVVIESKVLLPLFNTLFLTLLPIITAHEYGTRYLKTGNDAYALFNVSFLIFGVTSMFAGLAAPMPNAPNIIVTTHNSGVFLSGLILAFSMLDDRKSLLPFNGNKKRTLTIAATGAIAISILISLMAIYGILPLFFIQGQGPTPIRSIVLGSAIVFFLTASGLSLRNHYRSHVNLLWNATGFMLIALGLGAVFLQTSVGSMIGWSGRFAQYIGCLYLYFGIYLSQYEEKARLSDEQYREFVDSTDNLVTRVDGEGRVTMVNHRAVDVFGLTPSECIGLPAFSFVHPDDRDKTVRWFNEMKAGRSSNGKIQNRLLSAKGKTSNMLWASNFHYDDEGNITHVNSIASDVTELSQALADKDFLMKEVNHRVKNNLSILQSLLTLQIHSIDNEVAKNSLATISSRIRALSLIHEKLYKTSGVTHIDINDYLNTLTSQIFRSLTSEGHAIRLSLDIANVTLHINNVVPCGLIVNELLTNAIKHAFPEGGAGTVSISLKNSPDGQIVLSVKDNGRGMPEGFEPAGDTGLGMSIVQTLTRQLNGTFSHRNDQGSEFTVTFTPAIGH